MNLKFTPLIEVHKNLGAKIAPFGGWLMPIQYAGIIQEHNWTRKSASLFDICHMGEFYLDEDLKESGLDNIVSANLDSMPVKACRYGFLLDEKGNILDDMVTYRKGKDEWMLVVNAATTNADFKHIQSNLKIKTLKDISNNTAKLDLQGPLSRDVLKSLGCKDIESLTYYSFDYFVLLGNDVLISRTGYTGELGFEIYIESSKAVVLWNSLLKDERVRPAGLGARDTLRLEMNYPLYGQDISKDNNPIEAGFIKFIDFEKDFIGKDTLLNKRDNIDKKLVCFICDSRRAPRHNNKILIDKAVVGRVTSGSFSPSLGVGIGTGYVDKDKAVIDKDITITDGRKELSAKIVKRPFYKNGSLRR